MPTPCNLWVSDVEGSSEKEGREGSSDVFEISHHIHQPVDNTTGMATGVRVHSPLTIVKVIDKATGEYETVTTGIGAGDGIEFTGMEGSYLTSSWTGEVFLIHPDWSKKTLLKTSDQEINSADIGYNRAEQVVYVPTFFDNRVVAYRLEQK